MYLNTLLVGVSVIIIDTIVIFMMKCHQDKPDILRIFYEDIPLVYVIPINISYTLALFTFSFSSKWYIFITNIIVTNYIFKILLGKASVTLENKYDYFHLYSRYHNMLLHPNYYVNHSLFHSLDTLYIIFILLVYISFTNNKLKFNLFHGMTGLVGYFTFSLTFEDL